MLPNPGSGNGKRHLQEIAEPRPTAPCVWLGQSVVRKALQKPVNGDAAFQPRQAPACAWVDAQAESQVTIFGPLQQHVAGLLKLRRVAVGGPNAQRQ